MFKYYRDEFKREKEYAQQCRINWLRTLKNMRLSTDYEPPDKRAIRICSIAMKEKPWECLRSSFQDDPIEDYIRKGAYCAITCQSLWWCDTQIPYIFIRLLIWRAIQVLLFLILFVGILPPHEEADVILILSRGWIRFLFVAFTCVSAWCQFYSNFYNRRRREHSILMKSVNDADIAVYLHSPDFAASMRRQIKSDDVSFIYHKEVADYLDWYEKIGKKKYDEFIKTAIYYTDRYSENS